MADPLSFPSATPRHGLPLLFSGQAQKEAFVNAAHALTDILLHPCIEGTASAPPADPVEGECWLVGDMPTGPFAGHANAVASLQAGVWVFVPPRDGMRVFDAPTAQHLLYADGWRRAAAPTLPQGGTTVDAEARATLAQLVAALKQAGIVAGA